MSSSVAEPSLKDIPELHSLIVLLVAGGKQQPDSAGSNLLEPEHGFPNSL